MIIDSRYSRQILLNEIGETGQTKINKSQVAIVGCGGLGAIAAMYLAGAGIGSIILIDGDTPDITNIHRQVFYNGNETHSKSQILGQKINTLNPEVNVVIESNFLDKNNIDDLLTGVDIVLECTDDIMSKYLVNDFCAIENIPLVYGAIYKYEGYVSLFRNQEENDVHLRDIFPEPNPEIPTCSEVGVYNIIAGLIGLMQANEALKYLLRVGEGLANKLLTYECLSSKQIVLNLKKNWNVDLEDLYEKTLYTSASCASAPEIMASQLINNRSDYLLISVMPKGEHQAYDEKTKWSEISDIENSIKSSEPKPIVIYCRRGRVSKSVVSDLIKSNARRKIFSLEGGYKALQKYQSKSAD